jgi:hypothetical protein
VWSALEGPHRNIAGRLHDLTWYPPLHVSEGNLAARGLYDSMGFAVRADLPMCKIERLAARA